jgi:hypothetical protein
MLSGVVCLFDLSVFFFSFLKIHSATGFAESQAAWVVLDSPSKKVKNLVDPEKSG